MDKVKIVTDELNEVEHVIVDRGNGEFTSMTKANYDEQQAANDTNEL
jgi:hypothetical protein